MNICIFKGRLTSDIELKATQNGTSVASFSLAVDRNYTPKGQERQTDFITCVAWRHTAEFVSRWFHKGDMMAVAGEWQTRQFEDKNGNKRIANECVITTAEFCGGNKNDSQQGSQAPAEDNGDFTEIDCGDDLPF